MDKSDAILVAVLARSDALWLPNRRPAEHERTGNLWQLRQRYRECGVPWSSRFAGDGTDSNARVEAGKLLAKLRRDGLLDVTRGKADRSRYVRLTTEGDNRARALCGLPLASEAGELLGKIHGSERAAEFLGKRWTPEIDLIGQYNWGGNQEQQRESLSSLTWALLPLLVFGVVESNCDIEGRAWYRATGLSVPFAEPEAFDPDEDAGLLYWDEIQQGKATLMPQGPVTEIGDVPMPVGLLKLEAATA